MKTILFAILTSTCCLAQFGPQQLIDNQSIGSRMISPGDIDNDGDMDIVVASFIDDTIAWYENEEAGVTFEKHVVTVLLDGVRSARPADLDGDGDLDIVATSFNSGLLVWYMNLDGQGTFSLTQSIDNSIAGPIDAIAADLDDDDDMDVLCSAQNEGSISWYENMGVGVFGTQQILTTGSTGRFVQVGDLDGDTDLDIIASIASNNGIVWFENIDGNATFGPVQLVSPIATGPEDAMAVDLDGDDDLDLLFATPSLDIVAWHENLDGLGDFDLPQNISTNAGFPRSIHAEDLDNDGDMDVLSAGSDFSDGKIAWYKNLDGLGSFEEQTVIDNQPESFQSVTTTDIDGDGDFDVFASAQIENTVTWYENLTILGIDDLNGTKATLFPNPVKDFLNIDHGNIEILKIEVLTVFGTSLLEETENTSSIDLSHLPSGVLFVRLHTTKGIHIEKVLKR